MLTWHADLAGGMSKETKEEFWKQGIDCQETYEIQVMHMSRWPTHTRASTPANPPQRVRYTQRIKLHQRIMYISCSPSFIANGVPTGAHT